MSVFEKRIRDLVESLKDGRLQNEGREENIAYAFLDTVTDRDIETMKTKGISAV